MPVPAGLADTLPGDVLVVQAPPVLHVGLAGPPDARGVPTVISSSGRWRQVVHESWEDFSRGRPVFHSGYFGARTRWEVVSTALDLVGTPYHPMTWNCEHFVRHCHGVRKTSPQLVVAYGALATIAACALAWS